MEKLEIENQIEALEDDDFEKDMSFPALLRYYIGNGLRQDLAKMFSENILETTGQVLAKHITSEEEVSKIIQEIKFETNP